jgi:glycosyltransferase involved in cell wall biosynthesis
MHTGVLDRRIVGQINALLESGREVFLVTTPVSLDGTGIDGRVRVLSPQTIGRSTGLRAGGMKLYKKLPLPIRLWRRDIWYLARPSDLPPGTSTLIQLAQGLDVDVIHVHDLEALPAAVSIRDAMQARGLRPRLIYDSHELFPESELGFAFRRYWTRVEKRYIRAADRIITVNHSIAGEIAARYDVPLPDVLMNSVPEMGSRISVDFAAFAALFGTTPERLAAKRLVIYQGSLRRHLNVENLVRAMAHTSDQVMLLMIGQGVLEATVVKLIARHARGRVLRAPWIDPNTLLAYTRHAHLGVIPYLATCLNNMLATPGKLFEYLEAGVPICANRLPEVERIVQAGRFGACYDFTTPRKIAAAITDALARSDAGNFPGIRDETAKAPYRWPAHVHSLLRIYESLGC